MADAKAARKVAKKAASSVASMAEYSEALREY